MKNNIIKLALKRVGKNKTLPATSATTRITSIRKKKHHV